MAEAIFLLGLIFFLAFVFLALFDRARVPDVLLLILVGVVIAAVKVERVRSLYRAMAGAPTEAPVSEAAAT